MKYLLNHKQMQQCDINTMEYFGVISPVLMERAALCMTEEILRVTGGKQEPVLIVCGTGNNGGDGLAAARMLMQKDIPVDIWYPGNEEKASTEGKRQLEIVRKYKIPVYKEVPQKTYGCIVDCLFGIGLSRGVGGIYKDVIAQMNEMPGIKVAADIPSGIHTDSGQVMGIAFRADLTVTFGFRKLGHVLFPGVDYCGEVVLKDMGIDRYSLLDMQDLAFHLEEADLAQIAKRAQRSNKGTYGKLLLIAGARNMAGAAVLAAKGAYAAGVGLVRIVTPECNREIIQKLVPEAVLTTYDEDTEDVSFLEECFAWADAVVAGPGLSQSDTSERILEAVLGVEDKKVLFDADALNLIAKKDKVTLPKQCVVTPHLGEMQRLSNTAVKDQQKELIKVALDFAKGYNTVVVLKDAHTVIAGPGAETCINLTGNPGMAVGGSGDVLSGVIGCLLAGGQDAFMAACMGVYIHGRAGDLAATQNGMAGMSASDLVPSVKEVMRLAEMRGNDR
ncbi:MAG: NAD(P)H-hydrate dehydratase [Eubacterium sp.]|nr:NAD(P)H-hydrate dehydratase [Eubacterium sp.]